MQTVQPRLTFATRPVLDSMRVPSRDAVQPWRDREAQVSETAAVGDGQPLLVFPMFGGGPESTARLRDALGRGGFHCYDWGYGNDTGPRSGSLRRRLRRLEELVIDVFEHEHRPVTLLGWGLSGLYARELAKRATPLVRQVITLGTPFNTAAGRCTMLQPLLDASGHLPPALQQALRERPAVP